MGNTEKFDMVAKLYDSQERVRIANICSDIISNHIKEASKKTLIDFGCGTGLVGLKLVNKFGSVLFMDSSANMIDVVDQKIQDLKISNAKTLCYDIEVDPLPKIKADYIIMVQVLLHIKDTEKILKSMYDLLEKDGTLIIIDFDKNENIVSDEVHNGFDQEKLKSILLGVGFSSVTSKTFISVENIFMGKTASLFIMDCKK